MPLLFALTLFVSALLLFVVQPILGRMLLPLLGGSPVVWNTCMVFFQAGLLGGYLYAHFSTCWLNTRSQAILHLLVLAAAFSTLPIIVERTAALTQDEPVFGLLSILFLNAGLPFIAVSATAPLLQRWFAATRSRSASDPYFLYAASNLGSLLALLAYPFVVEPLLSLHRQSTLWRYVFVGLGVAIAICAACVPKTPRLLNPETKGTTPGAGLWVLRAFVPSSLLLGVTSFLTTDIAPMPLLWVVPLALYLLTFIVAFSTRIRLPLAFLGRCLAVAVLALVIALLIGATEPVWLVLPIHLLAFTLAGLLCHGLLARDRPPAQQLTRFYLWLSVGGVLGGVFNALLAPILFEKLGLVEYPLMLLAVCLFRPVSDQQRAWRRWDWAAPILVGLAAAALFFAAISSTRFGDWFKQLSAESGLPVEMVRSSLLFGIPALIVYTFVDRPRRFALGLAALLLAATLNPGPWGTTLFLERNSLGILRVTADPEGRFHRLVHGNTIHGQQRIGPNPRFIAASLLSLAGRPFSEAAVLAVMETAGPMPNEPLTYYHPKGPVGDIFRQIVHTWKGPRRIGVVGLGIGSMIAYAKPDQEWTFFELDPAVIRIARDERFFTFLRDSRAKTLDIVAGDARIQLAQVPDGQFDLLVLDAFSSDAIPLHLLTKEALALYRKKLAPGGLLLFHVSNRYLDLPPVLAKLAEAETPMVSRLADDLSITDDDRTAGKFPSQWAILAYAESDLGPLFKPTSRWSKIRIQPDTPFWTDDRADLLGAWRRGTAE